MTPIRLAADRVHAWRIERQLLGRERATTPAEVASHLVGVQAQVTSSAALAIALRSARPRGSMTPADSTAHALLDRSVVRSWAMRGTLHLFAASDVPLIAAALKGEEKWHRPAWLRWFGLTDAQVGALVESICEILDDGVPRTRAELAVIVGERLGPEAGRHLLGSWGGVLKVASSMHYLVQSAEIDAGVRFVRASRWIAGWREHEPASALTTLLGRYLAAYGPASVKEVQRWWGVATLAQLRPAIAELGSDVADVEVDGDRALTRRDDLAAIEATRPTRGAVCFLGGFDPLVVGGGLRSQLIPAAHLKLVSRTAGWISPVVLVDGRAAAVWDGRTGGSRLAITVDAFEPFAPDLRRAVGLAAEAVGAAQGLPVDVVFGRTFEARR